MMEEEETLRKTRKHRKRKTIRDSTPLTDEDSLLGDLWEDDDKIDGEKIRKKRGRKPKERDSTVTSVNDDILEPKTELQQIYSVVEQLKNSTLAIPFMDRPNEKMEFMSDYYEIITNPMWLKEIDRKYEEDEYTTATEIASDIRLMLENCYHYWGPSDELTKKGVKLEQRFEQKLSQLNAETQKLCSLEATHGEQVDIKVEDESSAKPNPSTSQRPQPKKGYSSRLLLWVISSNRGRAGGERPVSAREALATSQRAEREEAEKELLLWETKHLITDDLADQIASMPEFPEIGHFFHLVYSVLNIEPVSHTEIERMLLMPQASTTLATVITSMLIPPLARAKLEAGPAMPYSIWTSKLNNKVAHWYRLYHSKGYNTLEVFEAIGIEPQFWLVMGEENPLKDYQFHELCLLQRVWLLKGLCDFILHNHKLIQECINNLETEDLREMNIGRDNEGFSYHYFPMFSEIRIYRMAKIPDSKWEVFESGVQVAMTMLAEEDDSEEEIDDKISGFTRKPLHKPPKCVKKQYYDFKMVADSVEGLRCLVDEFCDADVKLLQGRGTNAALVASLNSIISQLEPIENKIVTAVYNVRSKMRDEWLAYANRGEDYVDPGLSYWQSREKADKMDEKVFDLAPELPDGEKCRENSESNEGNSERPDDEKRDCRERRSKRESQLKMIASSDGNKEDSESEEEFDEFFDDDSSEEWHVPGSKPKKTKRSPRRPKKLAEIIDKEEKNKTPVQIKEEFDSHTNISASVSITNNSRSVKKLHNDANDNLPVTIKKELPDPDTDDRFDTFSRVGVKQQMHQKQNATVSSKKSATASVLQRSPDSNVIQTLVPYSKGSTSKVDVSKVKRSISPVADSEIVYISDTEEPEDVKPTKEQLLKVGSVKTLTYSMTQNNAGSFINSQTAVNVGANPVFSVQPNPFLTQPNTIVPVQAQLQPQQITYAMPGQTVLQPNQILRPQQTVIQMQNPPTGLSPNQKYVVIQQPGTNTLPPGNQQSVFINKPGITQTGNNVFSTSPRMQAVNWYGPRNSSPIRGASPQNPMRMTSPRQRGQNFTVVQGRSPQQSMRGRGVRTPTTPVQMQRFSARTPNSSPRMNIRSPNSGVRVPGVGIRSPMAGVRSPGMRGGVTGVGVRTPILGPRTPTGMIRSPATATVGRGGDRMRPGAIRNLNFSTTPPKQNQSNLSNAFPDIEGELKVGETDNGGFGYVVVLADGGKISLTSEQLAQIRSDNGGILPKRCKVPIKQTK